jgi:hypothetical protein
MKKLLAIIICLGFVLCVTAAYAAPVGNIATPATLKQGIVYQDKDAQFAVVAGGEIDLTWDQKLKHQDKKTEYYFYGGKIGVLIMDRFMPYAILGGAEAKKQVFRIKDTSNKVEWDTKYDFVWGVGGTAMLYETKIEGMGNGTLRVGVDGRYRQSHLKVDKVKLNDDDAIKTSDSSVTDTRYHLDQWQVALAVSYQMDQFIPYIGAKYSDASGDAKTKISSTEYKVDFKNKTKVGMFVGGDFLVNDYFTANVEGRFFDETALSLGATVRF